MNHRWSKGDPVSLSDLIQITPLANEVLHLAEELDMSCSHVMWIISRILSGEDSADIGAPILEDLFAEDLGDLEMEEWENVDLEAISEDMDQAKHRVDVSISGAGRFQEIGFHAGVNDKEDMKYFFDMVLDMLNKLD